MITVAESPRKRRFLRKVQGKLEDSTGEDDCQDCKGDESQLKWYLKDHDKKELYAKPIPNLLNSGAGTFRHCGRKSSILTRTHP